MAGCNKSEEDTTQNGGNNTKKFDFETGSVSDGEGNVYKTIKINGVEWMAENLKATKYCDGSPISSSIASDYMQVLINKVPSYFSYNDDPAIAAKYGYLYNGFAVKDTRNICPCGWNVPTYDQLLQLILLVNPEHPVHPQDNGGGMLKASGTIESGNGLWNAPNTGGNNATGFAATPGGLYAIDSYTGLGKDAHYWSSSNFFFDFEPNEPIEDILWTLILDHNSPSYDFAGTASARIHSVRCVK